MKHKYVIIDSSKENHNSVDAKFKVQIPQGITGTTRVCVKTFSMPNSYHNIYGDLKTVKFVEFYRPTSGGDWVYEVFSFTLAEGYTETDYLFSEIQSKFTNASGNEITRQSDGTTTVQHVTVTRRLGSRIRRRCARDLHAGCRRARDRAVRRGVVWLDRLSCLRPN